MTAHVDYHHHLAMGCSNKNSMPALHGQEVAWNMPTGTFMLMHGRQYMSPYQSLQSPTYCPYAEELSLSQYDAITYPEPTLTAAPAPGAFHTSSTPSLTPSPIYSERNIIPENEIMESGHLQHTSPHSMMYAAPIPTPGASSKMRCQWKDCAIELDDLSHSGIRRHFRDFHSMERGSTVRCEWGGNCRSEEMLYDNIAKHIAECHLKSMRTACMSCGNSFARNDTLKRHLNSGCPALRQG